MREFRVDDYGAPLLPGARPDRHAADAEDEAGAGPRRRSARCSAATARPRTTRRARCRRCSTREPGLDRAALAAQLDAVAPEFTAGADEFGQLRPAVLRAWAAWDLKFGILHKPLDVRRAFDTTLVEKPQRND